MWWFWITFAFVALIMTRKLKPRRAVVVIALGAAAAGWVASVGMIG